MAASAADAPAGRSGGTAVWCCASCRRWSWARCCWRRSGSACPGSTWWLPWRRRCCLGMDRAHARPAADAPSHRRLHPGRLVALLWLRHQPGAADVLWLLPASGRPTSAPTPSAGRRRRQAGAPISPGKTWSGLFGGMAGPPGRLGRGLCLRPWPRIRPAAGWRSPGGRRADAAICSNPAAKRRAGVKDSGT